METQIFDNKQELINKSSTGRVLICANEQTIKVIEQGYVEDEEPIEVTKYTYDTLWLRPKKQTVDAIVSELKDYILNKITEYDSSINVNAFILNKKEVWLDKSTRVGLMNSLSVEKNAGKATSILWFDTIKLEVDIDAAIQMLSSLELYALECFNKTAEHKQAIEKLASIEDLMKYDYTIGYPSKLNFTV